MVCQERELVLALEREFFLVEQEQDVFLCRGEKWYLCGSKTCRIEGFSLWRTHGCWSCRNERGSPSGAKDSPYAVFIELFEVHERVRAKLGALKTKFGGNRRQRLGEKCFRGSPEKPNGTTEQTAGHHMVSDL